MTEYSSDQSSTGLIGRQNNNTRKDNTGQVAAPRGEPDLDLSRDGNLSAVAGSAAARPAAAALHHSERLPPPLDEARLLRLE